MNKKEKLFITILAAALIFGGIYKVYDLMLEKHEPDQVRGEAEEVLASDFTVYDEEGNKVQLSEYIGKPIVVNFWASWCTPCQIEMPYFQETYMEHKDKVHFLMVNLTASGGETVDRAAAFVKNGGYTLPVFFDTEHDAAATYGTTAVPTTIFINEEGYIVSRIAGAIDKETIQDGIDMILEE